MDKKLKIVFMGVPIVGGNYTHFQYLSEGLNDYDWILLQIGKMEKEYLVDKHFVNIGGELDRSTHQKELAILLKNYLEENNIDILIPMNSGVAISIIPFLSPTIQIINIVNSNTERVYKCVTEHLSYISKIVAISQKQIAELQKKGISGQKLQLIPHGVSAVFESNRVINPKFKIGFLGRVHHGHKGVLLIPEILEKLAFPFEFEIIGDGQDKPKLLQELKDRNITFIDYGFKNGKEKEEIMQKWDTMLFPSYVEGFGLTLIECMKHGIIPIAHYLEGITDYIIEDKKDGFLVDKNSINGFVINLNFLAHNATLKQEMAINAHQKIHDKFNIGSVLKIYRKVFEESTLFQKPSQKPLKMWQEYKEYKPSIIKRVLAKLKRYGK